MASLKCTICSNPFTDPRLLPCLHVYCKSCLESLESQDEGTLTCPSCYKPSSCSPSRLPRHIRIEREAALLKMQQQVSTEATCGMCEEKSTLEAYCEDCALVVCSECVNSHKRLKPLRTHKVVPLQSVQSCQSIFWKLPSCSEHNGEVLRFYCNSCSSIICAECIRHHKEHKWEPIDLAAETEKAKMESLLPRMNDAISPIAEAVQEINDVIESIITNKEQIKKEIEGMFDKIFHIIQTRRHELLEEVDKSSLAKTTQLDIQKESLEKIRKALQLTFDSGTTACSEYDQVELLAMNDYIQQAANECLDESASVDTSPVCISNLTLVADEDILKTLSELGEVEESILKPTASSESPAEDIEANSEEDIEANSEEDIEANSEDDIEANSEDDIETDSDSEEADSDIRRDPIDLESISENPYHMMNHRARHGERRHSKEISTLPKLTPLSSNPSAFPMSTINNPKTHGVVGGRSRVSQSSLYSTGRGYDSETRRSSFLSSRPVSSSQFNNTYYNAPQNLQQSFYQPYSYMTDNLPKW